MVTEKKQTFSRHLGNHCLRDRVIKQEKNGKQTKVLPKITRFQDNGQKVPNSCFPFITKYRKRFISFSSSVGVGAGIKKKIYHNKREKIMEKKSKCY